MQAVKRVCLLTGASGTLGSAFCRLYAKEYDIAAVCHHRLPRVCCQSQQFVDPLKPKERVDENDQPVFVIQADITEDKQLARIVETALCRFGRIDLLVNAAVHYAFCPMLRTEQFIEDLPTQFMVNTIIPVKLASILVQRFWSSRQEDNLNARRHVINVSSTSGLYVFPHSGQSVYSASKAALNYLTLHMSEELSSIGIRVNAIAPTGFPSFVPTERVAEAITRLDEQSITGKILVIEENREWYA